MTTAAAVKTQTATITTRISLEDKKHFEDFCRKTGMTASTAINMFIKNTLQKQALPFTVGLDPFYSPENIKRLKKAMQDLEENKVTKHYLIEVDDE